MIHNNSNDPVFVKKISLNVWTLRDEIEAKIEERIKNSENPESINVEELRSEYLKKSKNSNVIELSSASSLDTGEDEMAKAMAEAANEEVKEENASLESSPENNNESNVVELNANSNSIDISVMPPSISEDKIYKGKTILAEIGMEKIFFFTNRAFTEGQSIVIQFVIPKTFIVNADIVYCRPFNLRTKVISKNNYSHRVLAKFNFLKEGERALLRQFIQSIEPDLSKYSKKTSAKDTPEGEGSDFDELDDLGL